MSEIIKLFGIHPDSLRGDLKKGYSKEIGERLLKDIQEAFKKTNSVWICAYEANNENKLLAKCSCQKLNNPIKTLDDIKFIYTPDDYPIGKL